MNAIEGIVHVGALAWAAHVFDGILYGVMLACAGHVFGPVYAKAWRDWRRPKAPLAPVVALDLAAGDLAPVPTARTLARWPVDPRASRFACGSPSGSSPPSC
jgi:hypothetical protein